MVSDTTSNWGGWAGDTSTLQHPISTVAPMGRSLRSDTPGNWHHIMNRGVDFGTVFFDDVGRLTFERLLGEAHDEHGLEIHAYCLMGNHFHLLGRDPGGALSRAMQQLSSSYTRIVNDRVGRDGPLFRGRFASVLVENDRQLIATSVYIHRNPIDLVPAEALPAYRWSSYPVYLARRTAPSWLSTGVIDQLLPIETHCELVANGIPEPERPAADVQISKALAAVGPIPNSIERPLALIVSAEFGRCRTPELVRRFGYPSAAAARMALSRARRQRASDETLSRFVDAVGAKLIVTAGV
jgi:REP element-mobilizing transposase RayT